MTKPRRPAGLWLRGLAAAGVLACLAACTMAGTLGPAGARSVGSGVAPATSSTTSSTLVDQQLTRLATVSVIPSLPDVPGYDRGCGPHRGCVFGPAWSDDTSAPGGHDGCDTRNQAVGLQCQQVVRRGPCKVVSGVLHDSYTGVDVSFSPVNISKIVGDHLVPLKVAYDLGAAQWTPERRAAFANDLNLEIIITTAAVNTQKGDKGIGQWQPPNTAFRCEYATRYLAVTVAYHLKLTQQDHDVLAELLPTCSNQTPTPGGTG